MAAAVAVVGVHLEVPHLTKVTRMATPKEGLLRSPTPMRHHQILGRNRATTKDHHRTNHRRNQAGNDQICLLGVRMRTQDQIRAVIRTQDRTQGAIQTQDRIQGAIQKLDRVQEDIKIQTQGRTTQILIRIQMLMQTQTQNPGGKGRAKKLANEKRSVRSPRPCARRRRRMRSG